MKSHIFPAIKLTLCCVVLLSVLYPLSVFCVGLLTAPNYGKGETVQVAGRVAGYHLIGQPFSADKYFWSRPSAVGYNAAGSAGSNKGPSNPEYLATVQARLDSFLVHNPGVTAAQVPSELITASGSGLDPDLSPAGAQVQAARIARVRKIDVATVNRLIAEHTEKPLLGLFGTSTVNVLSLNRALDAL